MSGVGRALWSVHAPTDKISPTTNATGTCTWSDGPPGQLRLQRRSSLRCVVSLPAVAGDVRRRVARRRSDLARAVPCLRCWLGPRGCTCRVSSVGARSAGRSGRDQPVCRVSHSRTARGDHPPARCCGAGHTRPAGTKRPNSERAAFLASPYCAERSELAMAHRRVALICRRVAACRRVKTTLRGRKLLGGITRLG